MTPTSCESCDFVVIATRDKPPWRWMCSRFPRIEGLNPVAPKQLVTHSPFNKCENINVGFCPLWEKRREGKKDERDS